MILEYSICVNFIFIFRLYVVMWNVGFKVVLLFFICSVRVISYIIDIGIVFIDKGFFSGVIIVGLFYLFCVF